MRGGVGRAILVSRSAARKPRQKCVRRGQHAPEAIPENLALRPALAKMNKGRRSRSPQGQHMGKGREVAAGSLRLAPTAKTGRENEALEDRCQGSSGYSPEKTGASE